MPTLKSYAEVQAYLRSTFTADLSPGGANAEDDAAQFAPHSNFWSTMMYQNFVSGNVPGVADPSTGGPMPMLIKGNSAKSNIVMALRGTPGSVFDGNGAIGRMPADGAAFLTDEQVQPLADWIDKGCPEV